MRLAPISRAALIALMPVLAITVASSRQAMAAPAEVAGRNGRPVVLFANTALRPTLSEITGPGDESLGQPALVQPDAAGRRQPMAATGQKDKAPHSERVPGVPRGN